MKRLLIAFTLISLHFSIVPKQVLASHAMAIDFYYECLGGNTYQFTMAFYRDCAGISPPASVTIVGSSSCGNTTFTLNPVDSCTEVTTLCVGNPNSTCNGGSEPGSQQCIYTDTVTLASCMDWVFSFTECCRNALITNLVNPDNEDMYVEMTMDNSGGLCNNSPQFNEPPVPFICENEPFCYDHGATDPDGDSLVYSLINPMTAGGMAITYTSGYSVNYPVFTQSGSISIDPLTGIMCFTPLPGQVCIVTVQVEEYRNAVLIGTTLRDLQIIVLDCSTSAQPVEVNVPCGVDYVVLEVLDSILCSSIASDGSDFVLAGPGGPFTITNVTGINCGASTTKIQIDATPPLMVDSMYSLTIKIGTDSTTLINFCGEEMDDSTIISFSATPAPAQIFGETSICPGSTDLLTASNGASWLWNTGDTTQAISITPSNDTIYTVTVFNDTCSQTDSISVSVDPAPTAAFSISANPVCIGQPVSFTNNSFTGCFLPFLSYLWDFGDGGLFPDNSENPIHTYTSPGTYTVTLTTQDLLCGCENIFSLSITIEGPAIDSLTTTSASCTDNNGSAVLAVSGGAPPFTYIWSNGDTTAIADSLVAGAYSVTISDSSGCQEIESVIITQPDPVIVIDSITHNSCFGGADGALDLSVTGGVAPYSYSWSNGDTIEDLFNVPSGNYVVMVTDSAGCSVSFSAFISEPPQISTTFTTSGISCFGTCDGSASVVSGGGMPAYTYLWSNGCTSSTCLNLCAGVHGITVSDSKGCQVSDSIILSQPDLLTLNDSTINVSCNGGSDGAIFLSVAGGTPFYTYTPGGGGSGFTAGNYTFSVTDINGCTDINIVTVTEPLPITLTVLNDTFVCTGDNVSIWGIASGGSGSYTYVWDNGFIGSQQTVTLTSATNFSLNVVDGNSCSSGSATVQIFVSALPSVQTGAVSDTSGIGLGLAWVEVNLSPIPPYSFLWSDGLAQTTDTAYGLSTGTYTVTVTDGNGCLTVDTIVVDNFNTSISPASFEMSVKIIPNPTSGLLSIVGIPKRVTGAILIYNSLGSLVLNQSLDKQADLASLPDGVYLLQLHTSKGLVIRKVVRFTE